MAQGRGHFQTFHRRPLSINTSGLEAHDNPNFNGVRTPGIRRISGGNFALPRATYALPEPIEGDTQVRMDSSLGIDYGANSVRALIVDCSNGAELGSCVVDYPSGHQCVLPDRTNHHLARHGIWGASDHRAHRGVCRSSRKRLLRGWHRREERLCDADLRRLRNLAFLAPVRPLRLEQPFLPQSSQGSTRISKPLKRP